MSIQSTTPSCTFSLCFSDSFSLNSTALASTTALVAGVALATFEMISWLALTSVASAAVVCYLVSRYIHVLSPVQALELTTPLTRTLTPPPAPTQMTLISTTSDELPGPALPERTSSATQRIRSRPPVSPETTPLRAAVSSTSSFSRQELLDEVIGSPQRIELAVAEFQQEPITARRTLFGRLHESDEENDDLEEFSAAIDDLVSPTPVPTELPADGFRTLTSAANGALIMAQTSEVLESSPPPLLPLASLPIQSTGGTPQVFNLGVTDGSSGATLREVLFASDPSPTPRLPTPERVRSGRETTTFAQTFTGKYPSPGAQDPIPARHLQQGMEHRRKIVQLYEDHSALITEILDFDEAHSNPTVSTEEFHDPMRWVFEKKETLRSQQIAIGKAIEAMRSANLLGPGAKETFIRELNTRKRRLDTVLEGCLRRIQVQKK